MEYVNNIYPCTHIRITTFYTTRIMSYIHTYIHIYIYIYIYDWLHIKVCPTPKIRLLCHCTNISELVFLFEVQKYRYMLWVNTQIV